MFSRSRCPRRVALIRMIWCPGCRYEARTVQSCRSVEFEPHFAHPRACALDSRLDGHALEACALWVAVRISICLRGGWDQIYETNKIREEIPRESVGCQFGYPAPRVCTSVSQTEHLQPLVPGSKYVLLRLGDRRRRDSATRRIRPIPLEFIRDRLLFHAS